MGWHGSRGGGTREESCKQARDGKSGTLFCEMCAGDWWVVRAAECGRRETNSGKMVFVYQLQPGKLNRRYKSPAVRKDKFAHCLLLTTTNSSVCAFDCLLLSGGARPLYMLSVHSFPCIACMKAGVSWTMNIFHKPAPYYRTLHRPLTIASSHSTNSATLLTRIV